MTPWQTLQEKIVHAIPLLCELTDDNYEQIIERLQELGINRQEADKMIVFVPIAFGRLVMKQFPQLDLPNTFCVRDAERDNKWDCEFLLTNEPIYCSAVQVAENFPQHQITSEQFRTLIRESSEVTVLNELLGAGLEVEGAVLAPIHLNGFTTEDFTP